MHLRGALILALAAGSCGGGPAAIGPTLPPVEAPPPVEPPAEKAAAPPAKKLGNEPDVPAGPAAARVRELAKLAQSVTAAFVNTTPQPSVDGKTLFFLSNRDGVATLYAAPAGDPAAPARRLVDRKERIDGFIVTRDGKSVIFASDVGADENDRLFRVPVDGGEVVELTAGETMQRSVPIEPRGKPGKIYFSGGKKEESRVTLYELAVEGGEPRAVYESPQSGFLMDVSRDGKTMAFLRVVSASEGIVELVDVASGKMRPLVARPTTKAAIEDATFSADGARLFVATDAGGDKPQLLAYDVKTGAVSSRRSEERGAWGSSFGRCSLSPRGDRLACALAVGERHEVRLYDTRTLKPAGVPKLPPGSGGPSSEWSPDGASFYATWSTPAQPTDLYAVDVKTGAATPLRKEQRPGLDALPALEVSTASFKAHDGLDVELNVYLPPAAKDGKKVPVIVSYHGGPASVSSLRWSPYTRFFTALGYAVVEPNVRGSSGFGRAFEMGDDGRKRLEAFKDIENAGAWVAEQPWADKDRLVILGGSYGGYTVLIGLTRMPKLWRAGVDMVGMSDLVSFLQSTTGFIRDVFITEFGDLDKDREFLESISPLRDVGKIEDPLFVYAGANDPRVPRTESDQIVRALRERKVPVEYMVAPNEGHSLARTENQVMFMARVGRFLESVLK